MLHLLGKLLRLGLKLALAWRYFWQHGAAGHGLA
jgi:hypothetical protein